MADDDQPFAPSSDGIGVPAGDRWPGDVYSTPRDRRAMGTGMGAGRGISRSLSAGAEAEAGLTRQRSMSARLNEDRTKLELVERVNARAESGAESCRMPPPWFLPPDTFSAQAERVRTRLELGRDASALKMPLRLGERWLTSTVFSHLDSPAVRLFVCAVLASMIILHPALVLGWLSLTEEVGPFSEPSRSLPVRMHAVGAAFLWIGVLQMFDNLRQGVRLRVGWLKYVMAQLGVGADDFERIGLSPEAAELHAHDRNHVATTRSVYTNVIANRCDQIERNDRATRLCIAAEEASRAGHPVKATRLLAQAEALDPDSKTKIEERMRIRDQRARRNEAAALRKAADDLRLAGEPALAYDKDQQANELCPECADGRANGESALTRQSTVSRKRENAERLAQEQVLSHLGLGVPGWSSCLDRPFVQTEIRWALQYNKPIIVVAELDHKQEYGYFDFKQAREKYHDTEWAPILAIDAITYMRDEDHAQTMMRKILDKSVEHKVPEAGARPINEPGKWNFFLSHAQATGGDQAQNTSLRLATLGKTCWYDNSMKDKSTEAMEEGVRCCGTFILFLTSRNESDWSNVSHEEARKDLYCRSVARLQARFRGNQSRMLDTHSRTYLPVIFNELRRLHQHDMQFHKNRRERLGGGGPQPAGSQFEELPRDEGEEDTAAYIPLSAEARAKFRSFLCHKQDVMPPESPLGVVRSVPDGYALSRLRWSAHRVADAVNVMGQRGRQQHALRTFSQKTYESLQNNRLRVSILCVVIWLLFACYMCMLFGGDDELLHMHTLSYILVAYCVVASILAVAVFAAWFLSLLLAVSLATDAVTDLRAVVAAWSPARGNMSHGYRTDYRKGNWYEVIQRPCLELVNSTLPALSHWGPCIATVFTTNWIFALMSVPLAIREYAETDQTVARRVYIGLAAVVMATMPMLTLYAPATVSTSVVKLLDLLNQLRVRSEAADEKTMRRMDRAAHLYSYVRHMNNMHGPGFIMMGQYVFDLIFLRHAMAVFTALASPLVAYLAQLAWATDHDSGAPASEQLGMGVCGLDSAQRAAMQAQAALINASCTYHLAVGPAGVELLDGC